LAPDGNDFKRGMRFLAGAVTIITTAWEGRRYGLTATAVCSLSVEPPTLIACVNRDASAHNPIVQSRRFCVNVVKNADMEIARCFSSRAAADIERRFALGDWAELATGAPCLSNSLASFDCALLERHEMRSHSMFVGMVEAAAVKPDGDALLYLNGQFRTLPLHA
jgi:flavin reductase (DIM6/NTAB) family NADH-FMN oxidoreductase RutF